MNSEGIIFSFMFHMLPPHLNAGHVVITTINLVSLPFSLVAQYTTFHLFVYEKRQNKLSSSEVEHHLPEAFQPR